MKGTRWTKEHVEREHALIRGHTCMKGPWSNEGIRWTKAYMDKGRTCKQGGLYT